MTNEIFLLIILILILLYFLPERKHGVKVRTQKRHNKSSSVSSDNIELDNLTENEDSETSNLSNQITLEINKISELEKKPQTSMEVINDYLSETKCEEGFETIVPKINMGNKMAFTTQPNLLSSNDLDKSLSKTLVPDFEPNYLNINSDLNSFGYATNNPEDNFYYANRGFINPIDASKYANSIQYDLAHPYQTRYCKN